MTIDVLKKQVAAAVAPLEAIVGKRGDYGRVQVNLHKGSEITGYFRLDSDIDINDIVAQAQVAEQQGRESTLFVFKGTDIPERAFWTCKIKEVIIPEGVTKIGDCAFQNCEMLQRVSLPQTLTLLGDWVFSHCESLTDIVFPDTMVSIGTTVFSKCVSLESVTLPEGITEIARSSFSGCAKLQNVVIPPTVTKIDDDAFYGCTALKGINIPDSITEIGDSAFVSCTSLESVTLPAGLTSVGSNAFAGCASLRSIVVPDSVTSIGLRAIGGCTELQDFESAHFKYSAGTLVNKTDGVLMAVSTHEAHVVVPEGICEIGNAVFKDRTNLCSVKLPSTLRKIGQEAFSGCTTLADIDIPASVTEIGRGTFKKCSSLKSVVIPEGISIIKDSTFTECTSLEFIILPHSLIELDWRSFDQCQKLTGVILPDGLTKIGGHTFNQCESLTEIDIPASVTEIGDGAFSSCIALQRVSIANKDTAIGSDAFYNCSALTEVDLPKGLSWSKVKNKFKNSPWGENVPAKTVEKRAKQAKVEAIASISLEAITKSTFAPHEAQVTVEDKKLTLLVTLPNGSVVMGAYDIDKKKDFTQIDQAPLQAAKARAEGQDSTLVVVGDNNEIDLDCKSTAAVKHVVFATTYKKLAKQALCGMESVETVELPECIDSISEMAFSRCKSLRAINLPSALDYLGRQAFAMCTSLTSIDIPDSCKFYTADTEIFFDCTSLVRVKLPNTLTRIPFRTFDGCTSLCEINIPDTVTDISRLAFLHCKALTFDSEHYSLTDGMLVNKDQKKLLDYTCTGATEVTIPKGIEVISEKAFYGRETLQSVTLPTSVRKVEAEAFKNCSALSRVAIGDPYIDIAINAFSGCAAITDVDLPAGLTWTKIKNRFKESPWGQTKPAAPAKKAPKAAGTSKGEKDLRSMTVTSAVKYIMQPYEATAAIVKIEYGWKEHGYYLEVSVPMPGGCLIYGKFGDADGQPFKDRKFTAGDIDIDSLIAIKQRVEQEQLTNTVYQTGNACRKCDITEIVQSAQAQQLILTSTVLYSDCKKNATLQSVKIEATGECSYDFKGCTALNRVEIADGATFIPYEAFLDCTALQSVNMPDSLSYIKDGAFKGCSSLAELSIPDGVTVLDSEFIRGTAIKRISLPSALEGVSHASFAGTDLEECEFENDHFKMQDGMLIDKAKNEVVALFAHYNTVKSVTIPEGVKAIDYEVFDGCQTLQSVVMPQGVESIGWSAFGNTALQSVVLPASVKGIGPYAFENCKSLTKVVIENPEIVLNDDAFSGCESLTEVVLPKGLTWSKIKNRFKNSPWGQTKPAK